MRSFMIITYITTFILFMTGCGNGCSKTKKDKVLTEANKILKQKAEDAEKKAKEAEKKAEDAEKKAKEAEKKAEDAEKKAEERSFILSLIASLALGTGLLLIGGFIFFCTRRPESPPKVNDISQCPRCGWEHSPEETICKNCKTHF